MCEKNGKYVEVNDCCYEISLIDSATLAKYGHHSGPGFLWFITIIFPSSSHATTDGFLSEYCDGESLRENKLFQEDPTAFQIQLYYDEVEICNPIGSKIKIRKLGI